MKILSGQLMDELFSLQTKEMGLVYTGVNFSMAVGCRNTCLGDCGGSCAGECDDSCAGECDDSCSGNCEESCHSDCESFDY